MSRAIVTLSATQALSKLRSKEISATELTKAVLERAKQVQVLNLFLEITEAKALEQAAAADAAYAAGNAGTLAGLPLGIKDLFCTAGIKTTAASKMLAPFVPAYESTVTAKLWAAGAVNVGKLNMDEFAMGGSGENSAFGPTRNPWDASRVPGGSSSGSAAAVAAYACFGATGSDTGGSIRQPASFTGTVGIKPTYGRCSRFGMVAFASSLDQAGVFARTTADAALLLQTIAGHDPNDSTSAPLAVPNWVGELGQANLKGLKIGLPKEYFIDALNPVIKDAVMAAAKRFAAEGAELVDVSLPSTPYAVAAYYIVAPAEAASNLARYDGMRYGLRVEGNGLIETYINSRTAGFGDEVKRRIMVGNYALSSGYYDAYYTKAMQVRTLIANEFDAVFKQVDVLFCPTAPSLPFKIGAKANDPVSLYLEDAFTIPASMAGLPGLSVPCGTAHEGDVTLPIGLQMIGPRWQEGRLLQLAQAWEQLRGTFTTPFKIY
ncbi:MAG: Asp-tRNA(Asn)/Glu-tRNA(Gln) amidotransferase subunit GatA [Alphaproteobacteria bacterium]|nr:Asp-tRNA(Asn)/Glu-tRNA(Gln) amidotransferase subunit GatA [Alphaproteobacteria bacterium]